MRPPPRIPVRKTVGTAKVGQRSPQRDPIREEGVAAYA